MYTTFEVTVGVGKYGLSSTVVQTGEGIHVFVGGGERPHIGTLVLCQPRPSLTEDGSLSCTTSVLNLLGHKDNGVAVPLAETLSKELNQVVVVTGGVHIDAATSEELQVLLFHGQELGRQILARVSGQSPEQSPAQMPVLNREPQVAQISGPSWKQVRELVQEQVRELISEQIQEQIREQIQTQISGQIRELVREKIQEQMPAKIPASKPEATTESISERSKPVSQPKVTEREAAFLRLLAFGTPANR